MKTQKPPFGRKSPKESRMTRRQFLSGAAGAVIAPYIIPASALGGDGRPAPSDRITMGFIGVGSQGWHNMRTFMGFDGVQAIAICDVDATFRKRAKEHVEQYYAAEKASGSFKECSEYVDYRELCARPDLDAICCATPDHWHALISCEAMRNGKDVYCQKPESLTVCEGRVMVETARRYGRVFSGGSQRVWGDCQWYHRMMWSGAVGELREIHVNVKGPPHDRTLPAQPVPESLNWDLWLGPAPWRPYNERYHPYHWRPFRDFSGGDITNWGAHWIGGALFAAQLHDQPLPVEVIPPDGKENKWLTFVYENGVRMYLGGASDGRMSFKGTQGEIPERGKPKTAPPSIYVPNYRGSGIMGDFLACVKTRQRPFRDVERAHNTAATCHLANIAFWIKRRFRFDPVTEQIVGDEEANRLIARPMREPWVL